jgi:MoxR-like ATPase
VLSDEQRLKKARDILVAHKGKRNAINSAEIAKLLDIREKEKETRSMTRRLVLQAIKKYHLPVAATNRNPPGYFYIMNREELDEYRLSLQNRIYEQEDRLRVVTDNYVIQYGPLDEYTEDEE